MQKLITMVIIFCVFWSCRPQVAGNKGINLPNLSIPSSKTSFGCNFEAFGYEGVQLSTANLTCQKMKAKGFNHNQIAYMIATFEWEAGLVAKNEEDCADYVTYSYRKCGRGLIQFTQVDSVWLQYQSELNNNMANDPDGLLDAGQSIDVAILYMDKRNFRVLVPGNDLGNEFVAARRLVNGREGWKPRLNERAWHNAPDVASGIDRRGQEILQYMNK
jgi:hypothetical protein